MGWSAGPAQAGTAVAEAARDAARREQAAARRLLRADRLAIRGRATWPGTPRRWQYSSPVFGGYGTVNCLSGNLMTTIPIVAYPGKMPVSFALVHNSARCTIQYFPQPQPPIAMGWTHTLNVYLQGAGSEFVTVVHGDGSSDAYSQNVDQSFTPPAGVFDTLVLNGDGTYTLTRKGGVRLNFGTNDKLSTIVDLNGNTVTLAYGANGHVSSITDPSGRVLSLGYDASSRLSTITDPSNRQFSLSYDAGHFLQLVTLPSPGGGAPQPYCEFTTSLFGGQPFGPIASFRNRRGTAVRLLTYDGQGAWHCQKRLSTGKFRWWPSEGQEGVANLDVHELQLLLWNGNPAQAQVAPAWRPIAVSGVRPAHDDGQTGARTEGDRL
jgi:YD repeat-containing protein